MWLVVCLLLTSPTVICHFLISLAIIGLVLSYKIFNSNQLEEQNQLRLRDRIKSVMARTRARRQQNLLGASNVASQSASLATLALFLLAVPMVAYCLEQDAQLIEPIAGVAKSFIKTVTMGVPLSLNLDIGGLAKNFAYFTWRTGFPVTMPRGVMERAQNFYNRVSSDAAEVDLKEVDRKSLVHLKRDLDSIVDGIVENVRQSPDGLYTNHEEAMINGTTLRDACTKVGVQLRAYGLDLWNYRNIAGAVLGVPLMPTVASTIIGAAGYIPDLGLLTNMSAALPVDFQAAAQVSSSAIHTLDNVRSQIQSNVMSPLTSLLGRTMARPAMPQPTIAA